MRGALARQPAVLRSKSFLGATLHTLTVADGAIAKDHQTRGVATMGIYGRMLDDAYMNVKAYVDEALKNGCSVYAMTEALRNNAERIEDLVDYHENGENKPITRETAAKLEETQKIGDREAALKLMRQAIFPVTRDYAQKTVGKDLWSAFQKLADEGTAVESRYVTEDGYKYAWRLKDIPEHRWQDAHSNDTVSIEEYAQARGVSVDEVRAMIERDEILAEKDYRSNGGGMLIRNPGCTAPSLSGKHTFGPPWLDSSKMRPSTPGGEFV
jgi:hypothetical protein